jgi:hypothetical protein
MMSEGEVEEREEPQEMDKTHEKSGLDIAPHFIRASIPKSLVSAKLTIYSLCVSMRPPGLSAYHHGLGKWELTVRLWALSESRWSRAR